MNADRIAEIRERLDKATPGPWGTMHARPEDKKMSAIWAGSMASGALAYVGAEWTDAVADAELIAHAPDDLAFLLDLVCGEVETPCATCGGATRWQCSGCHKRFDGDLMAICPNCGREGYWTGSVAPCPDCGVETPEAAVEAVARSFAGFSDYRMNVLERQARQALNVLIAQGWTPPLTQSGAAESRPVF